MSSPISTSSTLLSASSLPSPPPSVDETVPSRPSPTSVPVQAAIQTLSPHLRLSTLLSSLRSLSQKLSLAQAHTAPFNHLHQTLQRVSLTTLRLANRTASTLAAFRHAADTSLDNLDLVSDLLSDDLSHVARSLLYGESATASRLAVQSRSLALQFDDAASSLSEALSAAVDTRAQQEAARAALAAQVADRWLGLRRARATRDAADCSLAEAERLYDAAAAREASARLKGTVLQAANVAAMVGSVVSTRSTNLGLVGVGSVAALAASVDGQLVRAREERAVHLRQKQDARAEKLTSGREAIELAERLRVVREEETIAQEALLALEEAVEALRTLAGVMLKAETFWSVVGESIRGGRVDSVLGLIQSGAELGEKERKALWRSPSLKNRTVAVQTQWVALQSICEECISGLGDARNGMYSTLVSNEESNPKSAEEIPRASKSCLGALELGDEEGSGDGIVVPAVAAGPSRCE